MRDSHITTRLPDALLREAGNHGPGAGLRLPRRDYRSGPSAKADRARHELCDSVVDLPGPSDHRPHRTARHFPAQDGVLKPGGAAGRGRGRSGRGTVPADAPEPGRTSTPRAAHACRRHPLLSVSSPPNAGLPRRRESRRSSAPDRPGGPASNSTGTRRNRRIFRGRTRARHPVPG